VINVRSEGRRFPKGRCLIPASHFFEFTGTKSPKSKWKFTKAGEDWFCFAGLCRPMPDGAGEAFTLLTTEPGPDVAPIHEASLAVIVPGPILIRVQCFEQRLRGQSTHRLFIKDAMYVCE
jgi:putative SOS response-associated peptidase YedK